MCLARQMSRPFNSFKMRFKLCATRKPKPEEKEAKNGKTNGNGHKETAASVDDWLRRTGISVHCVCCVYIEWFVCAGTFCYFVIQMLSVPLLCCLLSCVFLCFVLFGLVSM